MKVQNFKMRVNSQESEIVQKLSVEYQELLELCNERFDYDYETGFLLWKNRPSNRIEVGDIAGHLNRSGYVEVGVNGRLYPAHRLIFLMHHKHLPKCLDHIDNNPSNNLIDNLREATFSQNQHNQKLSSKNTSGVKGVSWVKGKNKWKVQIMFKGNRFNFGHFDDLEEASIVVRNKREELHKEFANHG